MRSKVEMNVSFKIQWTIENFLSISSNRGDFLESPYFKTAYGSTYESKWKFIVYPNGTIDNQDEDEIEIFTVVQSREEKYPGMFSTCIICSNGHQYFEVCLTQDNNRLTLSRSFLQQFSNIYLPDNNLRILCTTSPCDLPYYWNMESKMLLCKDLRNLRVSEEDCDLILVARYGDNNELKEIKVHKAILRARNCVFNAMFSHKMLENQTNRVEILDIDINTLQVLVDYFYFADYDFFDVHHAIDVYIAADKYLVSRLKRDCIGYLCMHLSIDNLQILLEFSKFFNESELQQACVAYFLNHRNNIRDTELISAFKHLSSNLAQS